jgi:hypothetical protein
LNKILHVHHQEPHRAAHSGTNGVRALTRSAHARRYVRDEGFGGEGLARGVGVT